MGGVYAEMIPIQVSDFAFQHADVPIKLNAAAIMREGKLFKEREAEVIKK